MKEVSTVAIKGVAIRGESGRSCVGADRDVNERGLVAIAEIVYHGQKGREERENSRESAERQRREGARRASELQAS